MVLLPPSPPSVQVVNPMSTRARCVYITGQHFCCQGQIVNTGEHMRPEQDQNRMPCRYVFTDGNRLFCRMNIFPISKKKDCACYGQGMLRSKEKPRGPSWWWVSTGVGTWCCPAWKIEGRDSNSKFKNQKDLIKAKSTGCGSNCLPKKRK